jgi:hypothetical protein
LSTFNSSAKALCKLIINLAGKHGIYEHICLIPATYEFLNIYHLSIKNGLIPQAKLDINASGTQINPATVAAQKTKTFFFGLKGIVRSLKLLYSSMRGGQAFNAAELELVLEKVINTCSMFYGDSAADIGKMQAFIDTILKAYARPFPYTPLFKLVKHTLADYGSAVEAYIYEYSIDERYRSMTEVPVPAELGTLAAEIAKKSSHFSNLVKGL